MDIKLPETLKIGGFDYTIELGESTNRELASKSAWGDHSVFLRRIRLSTDCSSQQFTLDVIHETLHAVNDIYANGTLDEDTIDALGNGLHQVFEQLGIDFIKGGQ